GMERFTVETETIDVRGAAAEVIEVRSTRWGPLAGQDGLGRPLALRATWLEAGGANLGVLDLAFAESVGAGVDVAAGFAGPSLNWMFADADGNVGWTVNGPLPSRYGFDGAVPRSWAGGELGW